jgi:hypothetical protein
MRTSRVLAVAMAVAAVPLTPASAATLGWRVTYRYQQQVNLRDVTASDIRTAWTVGETSTSSLPTQPVALRWNGKRWASAGVTSTLASRLTAVTTSGPGNTWAFGTKYVDPYHVTARALHWDGHGWRAVDLPSNSSALPWINTAVTFGPKETWAFGNYVVASNVPYAAHFDGRSWKAAKLPADLPFGAIDTAVGISPTNIWAVVSQRYSFAVIHYNGRSWHTVPLGGLLTSFAGGGLVARSSTDVWIAGMFPNGKSVLTPGVAHYNGKKWSVVPVPGETTSLGSLTDDGSGGLWAATLYSPTRIWHFHTGRWTKTTPAGSAASPYLAWMFHIPATRTTLAVGYENGPAILATGPF